MLEFVEGQILAGMVVDELDTVQFEVREVRKKRGCLYVLVLSEEEVKVAWELGKKIKER